MKYQVKVLLYRIAFSLIVVGCFILYRYSLYDYIIVLILLTLFVGIFPVSDADINYKNITINKSYFWSLASISRTIEYSQVSSIYSKEYSIETHEEAFRYADTLAASLLLYFNPPKVEWTTAKLTFIQGDKVRVIEVKLSRGEFRDIERRIRTVTNEEHIKYGSHKFPWY